MKLWRKKYEWVAYAACAGDDRFTAEENSESDIGEIERICAGCRVRPECMQWAVSEQASAVVVAGVRLPDPAFKRTLRRLYADFQRRLPEEFERRGDDI